MWIDFLSRDALSAEYGIAMLIVCLSVCDVEGPWSYVQVGLLRH